MANVTVRNLPDAVHRALRVRAAHHGRSTEAEIRDILEAAVRPAERVRLGSMLAAIAREAGGLTDSRRGRPCRGARRPCRAPGWRARATERSAQPVPPAVSGAARRSILVVPQHIPTGGLNALAHALDAPAHLRADTAIEYLHDTPAQVQGRDGVRDVLLALDGPHLELVANNAVAPDIGVALVVLRLPDSDRRWTGCTAMCAREPPASSGAQRSCRSASSRCW